MEEGFGARADILEGHVKRCSEHVQVAVVHTHRRRFCWKRIWAGIEKHCWCIASADIVLGYDTGAHASTKRRV